MVFLAGRVQSPGLRMAVIRERERIAFRKSEYWDIKATLSAKDKFEAKLIGYKNKRIATGKDFDSKTGKLAKGKDVTVVDEKLAKELAKKLKGSKFSVVSTEEKKFTQNPAIPFTTSTLQQEGNRKLGLSARDTMRVAQRLYENGLITYMRTDSPNLSNEAIMEPEVKLSLFMGKNIYRKSQDNIKRNLKGPKKLTKRSVQLVMSSLIQKTLVLMAKRKLYMS
jgi:DNA topoisomerase-1